MPTIQSGRRGRTQDRAKGDGLPTGKGTAATRDVSDPHPSNEEQYDRQHRPGRPKPRKPDFGPNDAVGQNVPRQSK